MVTAFCPFFSTSKPILLLLLPLQNLIEYSANRSFCQVFAPFSVSQFIFLNPFSLFYVYFSVHIPFSVTFCYYYTLQFQTFFQQFFPYVALPRKTYFKNVYFLQKCFYFNQNFWISQVFML